MNFSLFYIKRVTFALLAPRQPVDRTHPPCCTHPEEIFFGKRKGDVKILVGQVILELLFKTIVYSFLFLSFLDEKMLEGRVRTEDLFILSLVVPLTAYTVISWTFF